MSAVFRALHTPCWRAGPPTTGELRPRPTSGVGSTRPLSGNNGLVELDLSDRSGRDLFECFEDWVVQYGMPHHVIICQGHHKASLVKFAAARGVKVV